MIDDDAALADVSATELSRVIGLIYDCAVDSARWPAALEGMCGLIGARLGSIATYDPSEQSAQFASSWGADPNWKRWVDLYEQKYAALMPFFNFLPQSPLGEPKNTAWMMEFTGRTDFYETPFYKEWAEPAGLKDVVATIILRSESVYSVLQLHTPLDRDYVGPRELAIGRLLVPHVRRSVLVGDLIEMRRLEAESVKSTLDLLGTAVVLTDDEAQVVHANSAARTMFADRDPIASESGRLNARREVSNVALHSAIAQAAKEEAALGQAGIGIPVPFADGRPAVAHVLPLAKPPVRNGLAPAASAAVFIGTVDAEPPPAEAIAALYDLTPTEQRVLVNILNGRNRGETARHLGIAESTVKTHLDRVFSKTGMASQTELVRFAERLWTRIAP